MSIQGAEIGRKTESVASEMFKNILRKMLAKWFL